MKTPIDPKVARSYELYARACELIPGGTQLVSRRPSKFAEGVSPVYAASAKGARFTDVDGNSYIDWVSGIGAIILGYADEVVDDAVRAQIGRGATFSINNELEIELAEELVRRIPCAEMVRYAKCGGEACAIAVRIARGTTGREKVLFCGYHGWHDWYLAANLNQEPGLDAHLFPGIEPIGVPASLRGTAFPFSYGDLEALGETLERHRGTVAAVILEPFRSEWPPEGYLAAVKKLAAEHGAVLIFDEVSTGFRNSAGGVQPVLGVTPDMAVFAKSISNGYPMAAVVGTRAVMEPAARMFISSTYWSDTLGITAALTTLREVERRDVPRIIWNIGGRLLAGINAIAQETGAPVSCVGIETHPRLEFHVEPSTARKFAALYMQEMSRRGCFGYPSFYLNAAQGDAEISETLAAARETFRIIAEAHAENRVDDFLDCAPGQDPFRRLVK